jgi:hypothetical protein
MFTVKKLLSVKVIVRESDRESVEVSIDRQGLRQRDVQSGIPAGTLLCACITSRLFEGIR